MTHSLVRVEGYKSQYTQDQGSKKARIKIKLPVSGEDDREAEIQITYPNSKASVEDMIQFGVDELGAYSTKYAREKKVTQTSIDDYE